MAFSFQKYWLAPLIGLLLQACGGGDSADAWSPGTDSRPAAGTVMTQLPGASQLNLLTVQAVDFPDRDLPEAPITGAVATLQLPGDLADQLLTVRVGRVNEEARLAAQQEGTSIDTSQGTPATNYGHLLLTGRQLQQSGVILNPLSDYISRRTDDYVELQTHERIRYYQDAMATEFIRSDLTGDGLVNFDDVLAFNPQLPPHLQRITFDYLSAMRSPLSSGLTLEQTYAQAPEQLDAALLEAFDPHESVTPPSRSSATLGSLHIDVDTGGIITVAELPQVRLNDSNPRMIYRYDRSAPAATLTLYATPDEGWKFVRWAGCPEALTDGGCRIVANEDAHVSAQFGLTENTLLDDVPSLIELDSQGASYVAQYTGDVVEFSQVSDPALVQALTQASVDTVLARSSAEHPLQRITEILPANVANNWRFRLEDVDPGEVYSAVSAFDSGEVAVFDEVAQVKITLDGQEDPQLQQLQQQAQKLQSRSLSSPSSQLNAARDLAVWIPGHGRAIPAGHGYYLVDGGNGGFQLLRSESGVQLSSGQAAVRSVASACAANPLAPDCTLLSVSASRKARTLAASAANSASPAKCTMLLDLLPDQKLGCNVSLLEIKFQQGILVGKFKLEGNLAVTPYGSMSLRWMPLPVFPFAAVDFSANGRGVIDLTVGAEALAGVGYSGQAFGAVGVKDDKGTTQWNPLSFPANQSADSMSAMASGAGGTAPSTGVDQAAAQMPAGKTSAPAELKRVKSVSDTKTLLGIELLLNRASPAGVVFPVKLKAGITATTEGAIGLQVKMAKQVRMFYDMDVDIGARCKKVLKVTLCYGIKIPQRASGNFKVKTYSKLSMGVVANGEFSPGVQLAVTAGPRGVAESLLEGSAGASLPLALVGQIGGMQASNFPQDTIKQLPPTCGITGKSLAFGMDLKLAAAAKLKPGIDVKLGKKQVKITLLPEIKIFTLEHRIPLIATTLYSFPATPGGSGSEQCLPVEQRSAYLMPNEVSWNAGGLDWDQLNQVVTKTHQLIREDNGNLVLYALKRAGGSGGVTGKSKVWESGFTDHPGGRIAFDRHAGRLIAYDLREKVLKKWPDDKAAKNQVGSKLVLTSSGKLEIRNASNVRMWSIN
ncbi:hypothetical protein KUF54_11295 [Comamonas sp. Y33R10-2]|uniref:hypothetical protein n=1 Tax=Comamonas sp. Y33R10-2 TaxID=2853257 RepID=UPI001C5C8C83|nr:hypothetical protein [Comamonas sp. Y33R10-2]QXZ08651.1 hypothetical protein KUF54_11295 [Comamonas sp. Y33R10-2]